MCEITTLQIYVYDKYYYDHISNSIKNIVDKSIIDTPKIIHAFKTHALYDYLYKTEDLIFTILKHPKVLFIPLIDIIQLCKTYYDDYIIKYDSDHEIKIKLENTELQNIIFDYHKLMYDWIFSVNLIIVNDFITYHTKHNLYYFNMFKNKLMFKTVIDNLSSEIECSDKDIINKCKKYIINNFKITTTIHYTITDNTIKFNDTIVKVNELEPYLSYTITHNGHSKISIDSKIITSVYFDILKKWLFN